MIEERCPRSMKPLCAIRKEGLKLKPEQLQAICHAYDGRDMFVVAYRVSLSA